MMTEPFVIEDRILYRDAMMLVINKPGGIPVHKGRGEGGCLEDHFHQLQFGLPQPPCLAHRLDRGTSGCLVLGRHKQALKRLGLLFENNQISKTYWAVVHGVIHEDEGVIDEPLAKQSSKHYEWWMKVDRDNGKPSETRFKVLKRDENKTWLELTPITGRTHQLRVHTSFIGHPIIGDKIYGNKEDLDFLNLHARSIAIPLYPKKDPIVVTAPLPPHMESNS